MKYVIVTGANKGIGRAIVQLVLDEYPDTHVYLGSRNKTNGLEAIQAIRTELGVPKCEGRLSLLELDTSSDESVQKALEQIQNDGVTQIYGIINNAGIGRNHSLKTTLETNFWGPQRVNKAFGSLLQRPGGRIVNISSAGGPNFVDRCPDKGPSCLKRQLAEPWTIAGKVDELNNIASATTESDLNSKDDYYGFSKALLNAYTVLHARSEPDLIINSLTPGYIKTDMTKGQSATNPPSKGAVPAVWALMSEEIVEAPSGRYYGSDCVRSPLHVYRGPGDPPYTGPDGR